MAYYVNMITYNNTVTDRSASNGTSQPSKTSIEIGQIWRDCNRNRNHRLFMVVDFEGNKVVCKSLLTGKITKARRDQFNRGRTGFIYAADLEQILSASEYIDQIGEQDDFEVLNNKSKVDATILEAMGLTDDEISQVDAAVQNELNNIFKRNSICMICGEPICQGEAVTLKNHISEKPTTNELTLNPTALAALEFLKNSK